MSGNPTASYSPLVRLALFSGAVLAAVSVYSLYREWVRRKEEANEKKPAGNSREIVTPRIEYLEEHLVARQLAEERRRLLEQQDIEYVISEQIDAEKDRQKALKVDEARRLAELEEARRSTVIDALRKKHASLPPVPTEIGQHILELTVMMPEVENSSIKPQRVSRKWNADVNSLNDVFTWIETLALHEFGAHIIPSTFTLRSDFPRVSYARSSAEAQNSLQSLGLTGRVVLHIEESLKESS